VRVRLGLFWVYLLSWSAVTLQQICIESTNRASCARCSYPEPTRLKYGTRDGRTRDCLTRDGRVEQDNEQTRTSTKGTIIHPSPRDLLSRFLWFQQFQPEIQSDESLFKLYNNLILTNPLNRHHLNPVTYCKHQIGNAGLKTIARAQILGKYIQEVYSRSILREVYSGSILRILSEINPKQLNQGKKNE
jgi:hypothetical protein